MLSLISNYDQAINKIIEEIKETAKDDQIIICLYIWEPSFSSDLFLEELRRAAKRGVKIHIAVDFSYASNFARLIEKTKSFFPSIKELAKEFPNQVCLNHNRFPNHSKYFIFKKKNNSSAFFGGINISDRFKEWKDFLIYVKDDRVVDEILEKLEGQSQHYMGLNQKEIQFVTNQPRFKLYEVRSALYDFFADESFDKYVVSMAYIDSEGVDVLENALQRNVRVELILPQKANVYYHANIKSACRLIEKYNSIEINLHPKMVHTKAAVAYKSSVPKLSFVGSANFKKNSFYTLGEFNALIKNNELNAQLDGEMKILLKESRRMEKVTKYNKILAAFEEVFG